MIDDDDDDDDDDADVDDDAVGWKNDDDDCFAKRWRMIFQYQCQKLETRLGIESNILQNPIISVLQLNQGDEAVLDPRSRRRGGCAW